MEKFYLRGFEETFYSTIYGKTELLELADLLEMLKENIGDRPDFEKQEIIVDIDWHLFKIDLTLRGNYNG